MDDFGLDDDLDPAQIPYTSTYDNITSISCSILADEKQTEYMAGFDAACSDRIRQFDDESESDEEVNIYIHVTSWLFISWNDTCTMYMYLSFDSHYSTLQYTTV